MEKLKELLLQALQEGLYQIVVSAPRKKEPPSKLKVRPVMINNQLCYQVSSFIDTKVYHENQTAQELVQALPEMALQSFKQVEIHTKSWQATVLIGKKGNVTVRKKLVSSTKEPELSHNRKKKYLLNPERRPAFLQDLGVQTADGRIVNSRYDKFRQINRFLEFIEDILPALPTNRRVRIIDFGCGKSYLTFAMYDYLTAVKKLEVDIIGLDLKKDVIRTCNRLAEKYGYKDLHFYEGNIQNFTGADSVDMVVTLHACDTATDYALERAVKWGAEVILSVPCCHHEMNRQIKCEPLSPLFSYGLIQERSAALFTDALRARILETAGYDTQLLEFIDMEHTPKNILLRCTKRKRQAGNAAEVEYRRKVREEVERLTAFLQVQPTLWELLQE